MTLTKAMLPDTVCVSGNFYKIKTGHSHWFIFNNLIKNSENVFLDSFDFLFLEEPPTDKQAGLDALCIFFQDKTELPRDIKGGKKYIALDYELDSKYIYAALLQCYGIDLFEKQYHWHKVKAMIDSVTGTHLNEIMSIRGSEPTYKEQELRRAKMMYEIKDEIKEKKTTAKLNKFLSLLK